MAINFPNSPSVNDIHISGANRWQWNGSSWTRIGGVNSDSDTINSTNDNSTTTLYPVMVSGTGDQTAKIATTANKNLKFNAAEGDLTVGGDISGINANLTGILTASQYNSITAPGANITGVATALQLKGPLTSSGINVTGVSTFSGNVTVGGVLTYEDVKNVDSVGVITARNGAVVKTGTATTALIVEGDARITGILTVGTGSLKITDRDINAVGVVTGSNFKTGTTNVHSAGVELAGVNVLGADTPIGTGATVYNSGLFVGKQGAEFQGVVTASSFVGTEGELITGVGIRTAGGTVGWAATIIDFRGPGVSTAYYSATTGVGTVYFQGGGGSASVSISESAPSSPSAGDMWWDSDVGNLQIYYTDANSSQWVTANNAGPQGPQGAQGATGAQGHQGVQGAQGHQGVQGAAGAQGAQGRQGAQGVQGSVGIASLTISQTPPSSPAQGDMWWDSDDATLGLYYNDGNSSQWVNINHGPSGAQGAQGSTGAQGAQGHQGVQGAQGRQGATGNTGAQGHQGVQGATGAQGHQGVQGTTGAQGVQGAANATTINNNANNRLITGSGTANTLEGESTLTYDGTSTVELQPSSATPAIYVGDSNRTSAGQHLAEYRGYWNGTNVARMVFAAGDDTTNKDDGIITMHTTPSGGSSTERLRITSAGLVGINQSSIYATLHLKSHTNGWPGGILLEDSDSSGNGHGWNIHPDESDNLMFGRNTNLASNTVSHKLQIKSNGDVDIVDGDLIVTDKIVHSGDTNTAIRFPSADTFSVETAGSERIRITSGGNVNIGGNYTQSNAPLSVTTSANAYGMRLMTGSNVVCEILNNDSAGNSEIRGYYNNNSGTRGEGYRLEANGESFFNPGGTTGLSVKSGGQVLVGTSVAPAYTNRRFTVYDSTNSGTCALEIRGSSSGSSRLYFTSSTTAGQTGAYAGKVLYDHANNFMAFYANGSNERLRITSTGQLLVGTTSSSDQFHLLKSHNGHTRLIVQNNWGANATAQLKLISPTDEFQLAKYASGDAHISLSNSANIKFHIGGSERLRITSGGQLIQNTTHTTGNSSHQNTSWYGDDANHYDIEVNDFNEVFASKTHNANDYNSIVYKREKMTEYCDIEFTMTANAPSGTTYRHLGFAINGDGSDTWSNFDRLVIRHRPGNTNNNQIRLDKGGGGYGWNSESSSYPNFADGTERHWHIQIRKRTFVISVDGSLVGSFRSNADLVRSHGFFGFTIYEASTSSPTLKIRDFKIRNHTPNSLPGGNNAAFCARISTGNPSCSSTAHDKPADQEVFDNGSNYNTSNYRFTAPHAGVYQFHQTFNVYSSPNGQWAGFKVNGSTLYVGTKANSSWGSGDQNHVASATIQLEKGDYVTAWDVVSSSSTYSSGVAWNRFEGYCVASYK